MNFSHSTSLKEILQYYDDETIKRKIRDIVFDFNTESVVSLPAWTTVDDLHLVLGAIY